MSLREKLADLQHQLWSGWTQWFFQCGTQNPDGSITIPADLVARWQRQIATPYSELSPGEQDSDRLEADKVLQVIKEHQ